MMGRGKTGIKPAMRGGRGRGDDSNSGGEEKEEGKTKEEENVKERGRKESCRGVARVFICV